MSLKWFSIFISIKLPVMIDLVKDFSVLI